MSNALGRALRYVVTAWRDAAAYAKAGNAATFSGPLAMMAQAGQYQQATTVQTDAAYRLAITSAWVYSDITLIASRATAHDALPQVKQQAGEDLEDLGNHAFETLLRRPNGLMTGSFLLRYLTGWYLLAGNAYCFIATAEEGRGEPRELWPLPADAVLPLPGTLRAHRLTGEPVVDYEYTVNGRKETLPGEHVARWWIPNTFDYWSGLSPLSAAIMGVQIDHAQGRFMRDYFRKDNAVPTALATLPQNMGRADFDTAVELVREQIESGKRILFTRAGDLSLQTLTHTLEQMQLIAARQFNRDEIDRVYGVPQGLVSGGLSGDSRLAAEITFARNTVQPLADYFADVWTATIAPFYGEDIVVAAPNIIPQDRALEVSEYNAYSQDRTINENRAERDLDEVDHPLADLPVRLLPYIGPTYGVFAFGPRPAPNGSEGEDGESGEDEAPEMGDQAGQQSPDAMQQDMSGKAVALGLKAELDRWRRVALKEARAGRNPAAKAFASDIVPAAVRDYLASALDGAQADGLKAVFDTALTYKANPPLLQLAEQFRRALIRKEDGAATAMVRTWDSIWQSIAKEVVSISADVAERRARGEIIAPATIRQMERYQTLMRQVDGEMARLVPGMAADLRAAQLKAVDAALTESAGLTQAALPFPDEVAARIMTTWNRLPVEAIEAMVGVLQDGSPVQAVLARYGADAARGLAEALETGLAEGKGPREVARRMRQQWDIGKHKAELLARTEMLRAHRTAAVESYRRNPQTVKGWVWNANLGPRTCPACLALHGTAHSLDEPFNSHPACRCAPAPQPISWADLGITGIDERPALQEGDGARWLAQQPADVQRQILGAAYEGVRDGRIELGSLLEWRDDPTWGRQPQTARVL